MLGVLVQLIQKVLGVYTGDYLSVPEGTGSFEYLFHEIPGTLTDLGCEKMVVGPLTSFF